MRIDGATAVMFHMGDPIAQARAPGLLNARFAAAGTNAVLIPAQVAAPHLADVIEGLRGIQNAKGAVVTMPHKEAVAALVDDLTPAARLARSCNVIRREPGGRLVGGMLDGEAFVAGLAARGIPVAGKRVFLAGAGGAGAGIAFAVGEHGAAALSIYNRGAERAAALAERAGRAYPRMTVAVVGPNPRGHDIAVNATSLGMKAGDPAPCDTDGLTEGMVAAEVVIRAEPTRFLAEAAARGCTVQPGLAMLEAQVDLLIAFMMGQATA